MSTVHVELPAELLALAGDADLQPSRAAAQLIALELFRENRVSLGKAAELAGMALEEFMESRPAIVENSFSSGVATAAANVSGAAPRSEAETWIVG
jgi:hypothetical protein